MKGSESVINHLRHHSVLWHSDNTRLALKGYQLFTVHFEKEHETPRRWFVIITRRQKIAITIGLTKKPGDYPAGELEGEFLVGLLFGKK